MSPASKSVRYGHFLACPSLDIRRQNGGEEVITIIFTCMSVSKLLYTVAFIFFLFRSFSPGCLKEAYLVIYFD